MEFPSKHGDLQLNSGWWWLEHVLFSYILGTIYNPNWRTHIFRRGRVQPPTRMCGDMWSVQSVFYLIENWRITLWEWIWTWVPTCTIFWTWTMFFLGGFLSHRGTQGYPKLIQILTGVSITKHPFGPCVNYNDLDRALEMLVSRGEYPLKWP